MKLLIIEDELSLMTSIVQYFTQEKFGCDTAVSFEEGIRKIEDYQYDCIILDINLPGGNGLQLLRYLRQNKNRDGVIILSARDSLDDRIAGLDIGADDYLTKPFHLSELSARVKALIRRKYAEGASTLEIGILKVDLPSRSVFSNGHPVPLSKIEYDLLLFLMTNRNRVVSRQAIAEHVHDGPAEQIPSTDFVYSHIKNLKRKLKEKGCHDIIQTVYGLGYKLSL
ncbi:MAG TPA: response regulator transcription factor [Puia sp.]|jgi:DNA-binding response OmpR family regulator|nr:response regulator transcription factor [Puia sp.]